MRLFLAALISGASLLGTSSAHAVTTFFNDFGPGNTYQTLGALVVDGSSVFLGEDTAMPFTSLATGAVTQIDVGLTNNGGTNRATVGLYTDNAGSLGSLIESWPVSHQPEFGRTNDIVTKITGITGVSLTAGTAYFLYITPGAADTDDDWNQNSTGVVATVITFCSQPPPFCPMTHSATLGAFDVIGGTTTHHHHHVAAALAADPVVTPLPAALPLFATGLGALGLLGWRRKPRAEVAIIN